MSNMYGYYRSVSLQTALSRVKIENDHLMNGFWYGTYKLLDALKPPFLTRERLFTRLFMIKFIEATFVIRYWAMLLHRIIFLLFGFYLRNLQLLQSLAFLFNDDGAHFTKQSTSLDRC